MPFFSYAANDGAIGSNLGLDFYSRIDDAGDSITQAIVSRRLTEKGTYSSLGCGAPWLASERIDRRLLDELAGGNYTLLLRIADTKKATLTTSTLSLLAQCLVEKYKKIQKSASDDQTTLEQVWSIGLYMDGDTANSDYDILTDITRINAIIFKEKYDYTGTKNASAGAIASMLAGNPVAPLFQWTGATLSGSSNTGSWTLVASGTTVSGSAINIASSSNSALPWAGMCMATWSPTGWSIWGGSDSLFGEWFFDDLNASLAGDGGWVGLIPIPLVDASGSNLWFNASNFGKSEARDFFHTVPCTGIFCVTIGMNGGNQNLLGGFANVSIESLLEKHSKMMEPISWSDLSSQKMTNNSYQLPFLNIKFKDKIAGARVYMTEAPQQTKRLETDDTQEKKDAIFDAAFKCAMNEAGVAWDTLLANGFIGAGYTLQRNQTTMNISKTTVPVWPKETDNLAGCYTIRMGKWKEEAYKWLSTDLNEIQGFTDAMMNIILQIVDTDKKLDKLPSK
jgi:hypothetical protein